MQSPEVQAILLLFIGLGFVVVGFIQQRKRKKVSDNGVEVEGVIFDLVDDNNGRDSLQYPVIRFVTKEQIWITEQYNVSIIPFLAKKGQKVTVIYKADNPKEFIVKTMLDVAYVFIIIGIVLLIIGVILAVNYLL